MKLLIGWDIQDFTPAQPVELIGQYYQRISRGVRDPLAVSALALEQPGAGVGGQVVMVSIDIVYVAKDFLDEVRTRACAQVADLDPQAIILNATHVHTAPSWFVPFRWWKPADGAMQSAEIRAFLLERTVRAVVNAWQARQPGRVGAAASASIKASP